MSGWTCLIGWFRFTVPNATADEIIRLIGGDWIQDQKDFHGYTQSWLSRGNAGGLGRIGSAERIDGGLVQTRTEGCDKGSHEARQVAPVELVDLARGTAAR